MCKTLGFSQVMTWFLRHGHLVCVKQRAQFRAQSVPVTLYSTDYGEIWAFPWLIG